MGLAVDGPNQERRGNRKGWVRRIEVRVLSACTPSALTAKEELFGGILAKVLPENLFPM